MMNLKTSRFGEIEVPEDKEISFPNGLIGFPEQKKFVILKHKPDSSFFWLQSLSDGNLAFTMLSPFLFVPDYNPEVPENDQSFLNIGDSKNMEIYCMVVIPKGRPKDMTINLLSPVVVNPEKKLGIQTVLKDQTLPVRHRLVPACQSEEKAG